MQHREGLNRERLFDGTMPTKRGFEVWIKISHATALYGHDQDPDAAEVETSSTPIVRVALAGHKKVEFKTSSRGNRDLLQPDHEPILWNETFVVYASQLKLPLESVECEFHLVHGQGKRALPMGTATLSLASLVVAAQKAWDQKAKISLGVAEAETKILAAKEREAEAEKTRIQKIADAIDGVVTASSSLVAEDIDVRMAKIFMSKESAAQKRKAGAAAALQKKGEGGKKKKKSMLGLLRAQAKGIRADHASGHGAGLAAVAAASAIRAQSANATYERVCREQGVESAEREWRDRITAPIRRVSEVRIGKISQAHLLAVLPTKGMKNPHPQFAKRWPQISVEVSLRGWSPLDQVCLSRRDKRGNRVLATKKKSITGLRVTALKTHMTRLFAEARQKSGVNADTCVEYGKMPERLERWTRNRRKKKPETREEGSNERLARMKRELRKSKAQKDKQEDNASSDGVMHESGDIVAQTVAEKESVSVSDKSAPHTHTEQLTKEDASDSALTRQSPSVGNTPLDTAAVEE
jgi:hypothetical protein